MEIIAMIALAAVQPAGGAPPNDWQWDQSAPVCALRQDTIGGGSIEIRRTPAGYGTDIFIRPPTAVKVRKGHFGNAQLVTGPGGSVIADVDSGPDQHGHLEIHAVTLDPAFIGDFATARSIEVLHRRIQPISVDVKSASSAVAALRACEDRKMLGWGIDPQWWRGLRSRPDPMTPLRDRFSALDYPLDAAVRNIEADAVIRLDVGPDGKVKECSSINTGIYLDFELASCAVLKSVRFRPAIDQAGNAVSAPILVEVIFRLAAAQ